MKNWILSFLFIVCSLNLYAAEPGIEKTHTKEALNIKGVVLDAVTSESLTGAEVKILGSNEQTVFTNFDGEFEFPALAPGKYTLQIDYISYSKKIIYSVIPGKEKIQIELKQESAIQKFSNKLGNSQS